jgi:hypothetical protein
VVIIGNAAGGKSTLARAVAGHRGLKLTEADRLLWQPGWKLTPAEQYERRHAEAVAGDSLVIEGLPRQDSISRILERATEIILVDLSLRVHFWLAAERQMARMEGRVNHRRANMYGLMLMTLRREGCRLTLRDFTATFPGDGMEVFATFRVFLQAVAYAGRRKLCIGPSESALLLLDENLLLALIAATQSGNRSLLDAYLCWLTRADRMNVVSIAACALATALRAHRQWLLPSPEVLAQGSFPARMSTT